MSVPISLEITLSNDPQEISRPKHVLFRNMQRLFNTFSLIRIKPERRVYQIQFLKPTVPL